MTSQATIITNIGLLKAQRAPAEVIDRYVHDSGIAHALGGYAGWRKPIDHTECKLSLPAIIAQYGLRE
jgi:hypothetical protein